MKPNKASIYRDIERLLEWSIPVVERLPKSLPYRELGGKLVRDLSEALDFVVLAFQADGPLARLECINGMIMRMTSVKTSSPSPIAKASMKGAMGSGLKVECPPAITSGQLSSRSEEKTGISARSSNVSTFV